MVASSASGLHVAKEVYSVPPIGNKLRGKLAQRTDWSKHGEPTLSIEGRAALNRIVSAA